MLRLEQVHKRYRSGPRRVEALRGVDLAVEESGFFAVMGPSGSGKSTLLHLIAGLDRADSGTIAVHGEVVTAMGERRLTEFRRRRVVVQRRLRRNGAQRRAFICQLSAFSRTSNARPAVADG